MTAVDGLSFEVVPGRVTGFVGPNGAGKSTTLRMLLGLVEPDDGSATVLGLPYASLERPITVAGAVLEVQSFHPLRSGRNHLLVLAAASEHRRRARRRGARDRRHDGGGSAQGGLVLARDAAAARTWPRRCSATRRCCILDEPANGLDPHGIRWLRHDTPRPRRRGQGRARLEPSARRGRAHGRRRDRDRSRAAAPAGEPRGADRPTATTNLEDLFLDLTDGKGIR